MMNTTWNGFAKGDKVIMLVQTAGCTPDDEEVVYSAGSHATIAAVRRFGNHGAGVEVVIGYGGREIVNVFDDADLRDMGAMPFKKADE